MHACWVDMAKCEDRIRGREFWHVKVLLFTDPLCPSGEPVMNDFAEPEIFMHDHQLYLSLLLLEKHNTVWVKGPSHTFSNRLLVTKEVSSFLVKYCKQSQNTVSSTTKLCDSSSNPTAATGVGRFIHFTPNPSHLHDKMTRLTHQATSGLTSIKLGTLSAAQVCRPDTVCMFKIWPPWRLNNLLYLGRFSPHLWKYVTLISVFFQGI